jgi:hypothetical protein
LGLVAQKRKGNLDPTAGGSRSRMPGFHLRACPAFIAGFFAIFPAHCSALTKVGVQDLFPSLASVVPRYSFS